jgi:hypothetical protein
LPTNAILSGSVADGSILISADGLTLTWTFAATKMNMFRAGTYSVFSRMTLNGVTSQLISGTVSIVEGRPIMTTQSLRLKIASPSLRLSARPIYPLKLFKPVLGIGIASAQRAPTIRARLFGFGQKS